VQEEQSTTAVALDRVELRSVVDVTAVDSVKKDSSAHANTIDSAVSAGAAFLQRREIKQVFIGKNELEQELVMCPVSGAYVFGKDERIT
jgi:hypothetical protein